MKNIRNFFREIRYKGIERRERKIDERERERQREREKERKLEIERE